MQKASYLVLWGESQNFQNFGSAPASIHVLLILLPVQTISRDGVMKKVNDCDGN